MLSEYKVTSGFLWPLCLDAISFIRRRVWYTPLVKAWTLDNPPLVYFTEDMA